MRIAVSSLRTVEKNGGLDSFLLKSKKFEVLINDKLEELALIDIAIVNIPFLGSGAVWDTNNIEELFLTRSEGMNIGLSSIGAQIKQLGALDKNGLHLIFDNKNSKNSQILVNSPIAPGKIIQSKINQWKELVYHQTHRYGPTQSSVLVHSMSIPAGGYY